MLRILPVLVSLKLFSLQASALSCENFMDGFSSQPTPSKRCSYQSSEDCFKDTWHSTNKWTFTVEAERPERVVICAHGLADSPYYFKDVAGCMADQRTEVWGVRLAGHDDSTSGANISQGSWGQWKDQLCCAMKAARAQGKEPILCGFSTGGVSALVNSLSAECGKPAGLMLFSPAIYHHSGLLQKISQTKLSRWLGRLNLPVPSFGGRKLACSRYHNMYTSGVDYLNQGMGELYSMKVKLTIPTFAFFSSDDRIVNVEKGVEFLQSKTDSLDLVLMGQQSHDGLAYKERLNHSAIFRTAGCSQKNEVNPQFPVLCQRIKEFLEPL